MKQNSLKKLIQKEYIRSIIFPLLIIEVTLLVAYFWSNAYTNKATANALIRETKTHIEVISKHASTAINAEFKAISKITAFFQEKHENFFKSYNPLLVDTNNSNYSVLPNGIIINNTNDSPCSLFFSNIQKDSSKYRLEKAIATQELNSLYNATLKMNDNIAQLYFNSFDSMNRLCPPIPDQIKQYSDNVDMPLYNFYYLADKAHNPEKKVVWTDAYLDPVGQGWMISAIAPVYKDDFLEGVVGLDITIEQLINSIISIKLPYTSMAMLVDQNGNILGMNEGLETYLGIKELAKHDYSVPVKSTISKPKDFNLYTNQTNEFAKYLTALLKSDDTLASFNDEETSLIITHNLIPETKWRLVLILDKKSILENSNKLKDNIDFMGYVAVGLMTLFYAIFMIILIFRANKFANEILAPLNNLIRATKLLKEKLLFTPIEHSHITEINILLENFKSMSTELQELYSSMEQKIKDGVIANMETQKMMLYQSRLAQMGEMISMIAHQWRQPLGSISTVIASIRLKHNLKKFDLETAQGRAEQEAFLDFSIGKIENYIQFLTTTIDDFRNFFKPNQTKVETTLELLIEKTIKLIDKSLEAQRISIDIKISAANKFFTYESRVIQALINIFKNAQDAIAANKIEKGTIWLNAYEDSNFFIIEIEDNAGGIPKNIMPNIFDPYFSTKLEKNGTGLGLYMSKTIIVEHCNGSLEAINSENGAKFTIKIPKLESSSSNN